MSFSVMPKALANSFLDRVVLMTMMTSLVTSSSFLFSPGLRPKVRAYASRKKCSSRILRRSFVSALTSIDSRVTDTVSMVFL